ncbi:hypothetical protein P3S68_029738 [Capsicum galapagoense]
MGSTNQDEDDAIIEVATTSVLAIGVAIIVAYEHKSSISRVPYVNKDQEREFYMNSILNESDVHCVGQIRMSKHGFYELCNDLRRNMYSLMLPHYASSSFEALFNPYKITRWNHPIGDNKQSSDCVGAIDGIHVLSSVPIEQQNRFRGRKNTTQNVLAAINFNLKFTCVLVGWEGSAYDSRILNDTLERPHGLQIPQDKYYLYSDSLCILHNHIVDLDPNDMIIQEADVEAVIQPQNIQITQNSHGCQRNQTQRERREEARQWNEGL